MWLCAECGFRIAATCIEEQVAALANRVRLDERYFDLAEAMPIDETVRQQAINLSNRRAADSAGHDKRRSERVSRSLVAPAIRISEALTPIGKPFRIMVANISREGIGLVHSDRIYPERIAIELPSSNEDPMQLIARIVRDRPLTYPFYELGGEFVLRLGSLPKKLDRAIRLCR